MINKIIQELDFSTLKYEGAKLLTPPQALTFIGKLSALIPGSVIIKTSLGRALKAPCSVLDACQYLQQHGWTQIDQQKGVTNFIVSRGGRLPLVIYRLGNFTEITPLGVNKL